MNEPRPMTPLYVCHVCLKPIDPDPKDGCIHYEGVCTQEPLGEWVWGPVPVHEEPCRLGVKTPFDDQITGWSEHGELMTAWARRSASVTTGEPLIPGASHRLDEL